MWARSWKSSRNELSGLSSSLFVSVSLAALLLVVKTLRSDCGLTGEKLISQGSDGANLARGVMDERGSSKDEE